MKRQFAGLILLALAGLQGCKTGYNRTYNRSVDENPPACATAVANTELVDQGEKVFNLIAGLTCASSDYDDGYLIGQSLGSGNQLNNPDALAIDDPNNHSFSRLIENFEDITTQRPAIAAIDYESDQLFTEIELKDANKTLKAHWDNGGLVSISWMPLSPWQNDFTDIENNRGNADDRLFPVGGEIDLADLLDDTTTVYKVWERKLKAMAVALKDLQDKGVIVLWRPLPEMNSDLYWWGTQASDPDGSADSADLYVDLWLKMFDFFKEQGVHNLLWVYSPAESSDKYPIHWAYPGDEYVDVVAGIANNDDLSIKDYKAMVALGRPVAMAEYGPDPAGKLATSGLGTARGQFDNTAFADRLQGRYPAVAYWVSNHSSLLDPDTRSNLALVDNRGSKELMEEEFIISADKILDKKLRE